MYYPNRGYPRDQLVHAVLQQIHFLRAEAVLSGSVQHTTQLRIRQLIAERCINNALFIFWTHLQWILKRTRAFECLDNPVSYVGNHAAIADKEQSTRAARGIALDGYFGLAIQWVVGINNDPRV